MTVWIGKSNDTQMIVFNSKESIEKYFCDNMCDKYSVKLDTKRNYWVEVDDVLYTFLETEVISDDR